MSLTPTTMHFKSRDYLNFVIPPCWHVTDTQEMYFEQLSLKIFYLVLGLCLLNSRSVTTMRVQIPAQTGLRHTTEAETELFSSQLQIQVM